MKSFAFALILFLFFFLLVNQTITAQEKLNNSIRFYTGDFVEAKFKFPESPFIQTGISYEHRMDCKNWIGIKYFQFNPKFSSTECFDLAEREHQSHHLKNGLGISERSFHHFFLKKFYEVEFTVEHMFYVDDIHNRIGVSGSIEHCWVQLYLNALGELTPDGVKITGYIRQSNENYNGFVPAVMYDYNFYKQRINIGVDLRYHLYQRYDFERTDFLVHAGINF